MPRLSEEELDRLLKEGLRRASVREPSHDFDARVRARLRRPESRWLVFLQTARPVFVSCACSLILTLAVLQGISRISGTSPGRPQPQTSSSVALQPAPNRMRALDQELDMLDEETPTLGGFNAPSRPYSADPASHSVPPKAGHGASGRGKRTPTRFPA